MPVKNDSSGKTPQKKPAQFDRNATTGDAEGVPLKGSEVARIVREKNRLSTHEEKQAVSRFVMRPRARRRAIKELQASHEEFKGMTFLEILTLVLQELPKWLPIIAQIVAMFGEQDDNADDETPTAPAVKK